jgi:hypothetical protein
MVRAGNSIGLPDMFNRLDTAIIDYEHLIALKEKKPDIMDSETYMVALFSLGCTYARKGDGKKASACLRQVLEMDPNSKFAESAKNILTQIEAQDKK